MGLFKLIKGKNATISSLPQTKKGRRVRFSNKITYTPGKERCLTEDQARHVYKMLEMDKIINIETMKQEIEDDKMTRNRLKKRKTILKKILTKWSF